MNKQTLTSETNRRKYLSNTKSETQIRPKNAVFLSSHNTLRHELAKTVGAYMLRKWGDINLNPELVRKIKELEDTINKVMQPFPKQPVDFITECCPRDNLNRRIDLVRLSDCQHFEFETRKEIKKDNCFTFYI